MPCGSSPGTPTARSAKPSPLKSGPGSLGDGSALAWVGCSPATGSAQASTKTVLTTRVRSMWISPRYGLLVPAITRRLIEVQPLAGERVDSGVHRDQERPSAI